ncbi:MAG: acetyl-CoA carboxylase biotin carboxyl carrier protein subunit, partial [Pseudomonadota bacterium]
AAMLAAAALGRLAGEEPSPSDPNSPWRALTGFRLNAAPARTVRLYRDGEAVEAPIPQDGLGADVLLAQDGQIVVFEAGEAYAFEAVAPQALGGEGASGDGAITSPMPGKVVAVSVEAGQSVSRGQTLVTLEAMKMEHALAAPFDGVVETLSVAAGDQVSEGLVMVRLAPAA